MALVVDALSNLEYAIMNSLFVKYGVNSPLRVLELDFAFNDYRLGLTVLYHGSTEKQTSRRDQRT